MYITPVSFGKVVAVTGKSSKIKRINRKINNKGVVRFDVTSGYKESMTNGALGQAAQKGERVEVYVTGDDRYNLNGNINTLSSNISACYNTAILSVKEIVSKILDEDKK